MLMAACSSPARGEEGGPGTRATWTPSDAHINLIVHLAFSPDGKTLASANCQVVRFWDVSAALKYAGSKWRRVE
jgi:WD40 repeat protein